MIKPKLYGRLGNQCFQIAATIAHARKIKTSWAIPRVTEETRYWPNYFLHQIKRENISNHRMLNQYNEQRHCYDQIPTSPIDLCINGYFQSEKYWPSLEEKTEIGNELGFHCNRQDFIAIHVRRGDYVTQFADKHPPLDMTYYTEAMNYFISNGADHFKIYTDDIDFILNRFFKDVKFIGEPFIEISKHRDPLSDMRDMYNASGFIIANSTFSLFPALLRLDNPMVIAPDENKWYGPGNKHLETNDLMPERFIKI